jgi:PBP1b-binding outer membrane lipoprotein LpoB
MKMILASMALLILLVTGCRSTPSSGTATAQPSTPVHTNPYPPSLNLMGTPPPIYR